MVKMLWLEVVRGPTQEYNPTEGQRSDRGVICLE